MSGTIKGMQKATHHLHSQLIRFAKGAVRAWEHWLEEQQIEPTLTQSKPESAPRTASVGPQRALPSSTTET